MNHDVRMRLNGRRVQQLRADPPEMAQREMISIDWAKLFEVAAFPAEQARFLILSKIGEVPRTVIARKLGWDAKQLHAVEVAASRRLRKVKAVLRSMIDDDFTGGSSRQLSFARKTEAGQKLWNLRKLDRDFDETLSDERDYIHEQNTCEKS